MKRKRKERYRLWAAVAVLYAVVLPVSGLMGMTENRQNARMQSESVREVEPVNKQGAVKENEENPTGSETVFGELSLTAEQLDAAEAVFSSLESLDLEQAARLMDREQDVLADLFYETMGGTRYLYTPSGFTAQIEGEGMIFTMPGTVFYGYFKDGKPRGECLALQFINVDSPRYNYSYETTGADGTVSHWYMAASEGATVIDTRWTWMEEEKEYQLMSADAQSHGYFISEEQAGQVMWMNLLGWEV